MNLTGKKVHDTDPPTVVADLNGKIIHFNAKAATCLYPIKSGDNISRFLELDYLRKLTMFDNRVDVVVPKNCKFDRVYIKVLGTGATKTIELCFANCNGSAEIDLENDKKLYASYSDVISDDAIGAVKLNEFAKSVVSSMKNDLRFAYRKFEIEESSRDIELYANYSHLCAIAVGTIIALNEIDYKSSVKISVEKVLSDYVLKISLGVATFKEAEGLHAFVELYPNIAMRMLYIKALCDKDEIQYKFSVKPSEIIASYIITDMINENGKFSYTPFTTNIADIVAHFIDLYLYGESFKDEEGEEQE